MKRLSLRVQRIGRNVFGWVVYMDESLRGMRVLATSDDGNFRVISKWHPDLQYWDLYVNGNATHSDGGGFQRQYDTEAEAIQALTYIRECVAKINAEPQPEPVELAAAGWELIE